MFVMVFVPGEPFYPSLLFADKAGENQSRTPSGCSTPGVGSWPYPNTHKQTGKACQRQTLAYYEHS